MINFINKIDYQVAEYFHKLYLWGGSFITNLMNGISFVAEAGILFLLIGIGLALFKKTRKIGIGILFAVAIGFIFTNIILKPIITRARPFANIDTVFYRWWLDVGSTLEDGYSFPSGHTTATTAFALAIFLTTNKKYSWPILLLPIAMVSSRIYLMVHYFSDCLGGLVVGSVSATLAYFIIKFIYNGKLKFFVWIKEFDVFKPKSSTKSVFKKPVSTPKQEIVEKPIGPTFEYKTQQEENSDNEIVNTKNKENINDNIE